MKDEIKRKVIDWWFSEEGKMTDSRKELVEKAIELTLIESSKKLLEIYEENKVSDTSCININNDKKFIKQMENFLCVLKIEMRKLNQRGTGK